MTRRVAVAAALVVLTLLVGSRWVTNRSAVLANERVPSSPRPSVAPVVPPPTPSPSTSPSKQVAAPKPKPKRPGSGPFGSLKLTGRKQVALTFDDGPHAVWTPQVLDRLKAAKVKATFCVVGSQVKKHPELVRRIVREGHTLCNHSWNHELDLGTKKPAQIKANLEATNREIRKAVPNVKIKYFRHPGGKWTANAVKVADELGMQPLDWDVDPRDWEAKDAKLIGSRVIGGARSGSIILMHDGGGDRKATLGACPNVIKNLKSRFGIALLR
ncbi:polysaccharide deacetylase family protein [Asanoa sp. WMMD1127]|uniref:polysaccharide deacetylase family protein n=1 Tax=Asanoa sp. WMMD1127 TaxID=3016107 RepID=UPI00241609F2|nr:polysaccharide deacetylase family protein [Asanoa sp. WMMD1127]MDG4821897.1 polysaccharide deacetylase family protein [Asanoa sp. WMMD1127]